VLRTEIRVVMFSAVFVAGIAAIYWFTSYEHAGTTMLAVGAAAYSMMCGYLYLQARKLDAGHQGRPEDREDASPPAAGETEIGYFPSASVWPPAMGLGAVLIALGLVFGVWFFVIAAIFLVGAIIGYAVEAQAPH
jgi:hypothetical protein